MSVRLVYDYNYLNDLVAGQKELDDQSRTRITHTVLLRVGYNFGERWFALAMIPWVWQLERNQQLGGKVFENRANGLGDLIAMLGYRIVRGNPHTLSLAAGVKMPTGPIDRVNEDLGLLLNPDLQPGTGSWDGLFIIQSDSRYGSGWGLHGFGSYRLTSPAKRFDGQVDYEFGNEIQILAGGSYHLAAGSFGILPFLLVKYRHTAIDLTNGFETPNTGGHWLHLVPQLQMALNYHLGMDLRWEIPLYRRLRGTQLTTSHNFRVGFFYRFSEPIGRLNNI